MLSRLGRFTIKGEDFARAHQSKREHGMRGPTGTVGKKKHKILIPWSAGHLHLEYLGAHLIQLQSTEFKTKHAWLDMF